MGDSRSEKELQQIIARTEQFVKSELGNDPTGHDWWHIHRVVRTAERLAREEKADLFICTMAALLHDVADEKLNVSKEAGLQKVSDWLAALSLDDDERQHLMEIISTMSYNAGTNPPMRTPEGKVVQDADRLDAIGAIAIARTFLYAGWKGDPIHDPGLPPRDEMTAAEYRQGKSTAINHFHEKLLKLKERINTASARRIAEERHRYMQQYVEQFYKEWEGES
ncbi:HD domain-containing protein [Paenibacillus sp. GCM10027626]|uniref:HD domain-containing protein n=1 Tax=Paenibacillus sp. GCM10027626 TaxID=3273411 RepID=UPI00362B891B